MCEQGGSSASTLMRGLQVHVAVLAGGLGAAMPGQEGSPGSLACCVLLLLMLLYCPHPGLQPGASKCCALGTSAHAPCARRPCSTLAPTSPARKQSCATPTAADASCSSGVGVPGGTGMRTRHDAAAAAWRWSTHLELVKSVTTET